MTDRPPVVSDLEGPCPKRSNVNDYYWPPHDWFDQYDAWSKPWRRWKVCRYCGGRREP